LSQAIAHRDHAGLRGGCARFDKIGASPVPVEHLQRRLAVAFACGGADESIANRQTVDSGGRRSISEEFAWKHGSPSGLRERRSGLCQGSHRLIVSDGEEQADARTDSTRLTSKFGTT